MKMKFKVGDVVKCMKRNSWGGFTEITDEIRAIIIDADGLKYKIDTDLFNEKDLEKVDD
jgi:hypothetical protein